jgi:hypothetical protein
MGTRKMARQQKRKLLRQIGKDQKSAAGGRTLGKTQQALEHMRQIYEATVVEKTALLHQVRERDSLIAAATASSSKGLWIGKAESERVASGEIVGYEVVREDDDGFLLDVVTKEMLAEQEEAADDE